MTIMSKIKSTTPWLVTLIAVLSLVATFFTGGVTSETFTKKNGDEIKITFTVPAEETVLKLIDKCKLEKLGDLCPIHFGADAELTKKGAVTTPAEISDVVIVPTTTKSVSEIKNFINSAKIKPIILTKPVVEVKKVVVDEVQKEEVIIDNKK